MFCVTKKRSFFQHACSGNSKKDKRTNFKSTVQTNLNCLPSRKQRDYVLTSPWRRFKIRKCNSVITTRVFIAVVSIAVAEMKCYAKLLIIMNIIKQLYKQQQHCDRQHGRVSALTGILRVSLRNIFGSRLWNLKKIYFSVFRYCCFIMYIYHNHAPPLPPPPPPNMNRIARYSSSSSDCSWQLQLVAVAMRAKVNLRFC